LGREKHKDQLEDRLGKGAVSVSVYVSVSECLFCETNMGRL
jgi:hypothetical protein